MSYHKLLERQIRRHLPDSLATSNELAQMLGAISQAYQDADSDRDSIERSLHLMSDELTDSNAKLNQQLTEQRSLFKKLEEAHHQLLQSEKMASIGQLAAGVAHEINNPIGFVNSNICTLRTYVSDLLSILDGYETVETELCQESSTRLLNLKEQSDLAYIREDVMRLMDESTDGIRRVKQIVQDLKDFSHVDEPHWQFANLHQGLDSTLNIVQNEIKYVATVEKQYGELPVVECLASQMNQVFLNLLVNAAHSMHGKQGIITIRSGMSTQKDRVFFEFHDQGCGISKDKLTRIFDPFFTTKPVGKGTGLGLSLAYGIIKKHGGSIDVLSQVGVGTVFRIEIPLRQPETNIQQTTAEINS